MPLAATVTLVGVETAGESAARGVVGGSNAPPPASTACPARRRPRGGGRARRRDGCGRDELERLDRLGEIVERPHTHATVGRRRDEIVRRRRADERRAVDRMRVASGRDERALHRRRAGARVPQHHLAAVGAANQHGRLEVGKRNRGDLRRARENKLGPLEQIAGAPHAHDAVRVDHAAGGGGLGRRHCDGEQRRLRARPLERHHGALAAPALVDKRRARTQTAVGGAVGIVVGGGARKVGQHVESLIEVHRALNRRHNGGDEARKRVRLRDRKAVRVADAPLRHRQRNGHWRSSSSSSSSQNSIRQHHRSWPHWQPVRPWR
jgi:hypothetical protein